ncbi:2-succinyl-6-hydroxy-2,4-cyclohexadiene-1-carboxylate synthase [Heyndrickxia ginsengihumi]|uniref:2-succinyl-6-hydroxy-2, 4-cyclohexadiene-1-carboxylate synthase n=1 Tax=Heyndrickxia ginsengihumi TaxID=363870 RepID=UPI00046FB048|nr:2-succinyl-6-hydroxy-2,4-cyclohexadiene-1-carboxylate synthase [Heyndrickxia ginsengihumi]
MNINGVYYHVEVIGKGTPVLCLHGFTGDGNTWKKMTDLLQSQYQVILVDILGHGQSAKPTDPNRYDIEKVAQDLHEIVNNLGIDRVNIIGYSMGGRLAITFAVLYPEKVKSLLLESTSPGLKTENEREERREKDGQLANMIEEKGIEAFVSYWTNIPLFASQKSLPIQKQEAIRKQRLENDPIGLANSLRGMGTGAQHSWWDHLSRLSMPILLVTGSLDQKFCKIAEEMKQSLANAEHMTVLNVGHAIHVEVPEKFGTIVKGFLDKRYF